MSKTVVIEPTCPKCGSSNIQRQHRTEAEAESGLVPVKCKRCGYEFYLD